jgi:general secretion pathway protein J
MSAQRGFSLLELLVALAVLGLLASLGFRGLGSILDTEAHVRDEARRWNDVGLLMAQLREDLSLAVERPALVLSHSPAQSELLVTRFADAESGAGPLRRVAYRLRGGAVEYLVWPQPGPAGGPPLAHPVLQKVGNLQLRALRDDGAWSPVWPVGGQALPRAIAAEITLERGERITRLFPLR